jgi:hypothetical protein
VLLKEVLQISPKAKLKEASKPQERLKKVEMDLIRE